MNVVEGMSKDL